jgi:Domain of unknown function (DUF1707)
MTDLRASDAQRERTVEHLREQALAGRLTVDELDERCERAYAAVTVSQLAVLVEDLPRPAPAPQPAPQPVPDVGPPGVRPFTYQWHSPIAPHDAMDAALRHIVPALHAQGYELVERSDTRLGFVYSYRPGWTYPLAVVLLPFSLLVLLHRVEEHVWIDIEPDPTRGGTRTIIRGSAPRRVRRAFAQLLGP